MQQKFPNKITLHMWLSNLTWSEAMHNMSVNKLSLVLPTTVGTFRGLNCFGHIIYVPQTNTYKYCKTFDSASYIK